MFSETRLTLGVLRRCEAVTALCDWVLQKNCQDNVEECGKAEVDEGQAAAQKSDRTNANTKGVVEDLELKASVRFSMTYSEFRECSHGR